MSDSELLITGVNFSRLVGERLSATKVLKPSVTSAGLLYYFEGLPSGQLAAVIAVYATESLAKSAVENQIVRTSVGPSKREPSAQGELIFWEGRDPMLGSMLLRHKNVVIRLLNGISWSNRLALLTYLDQALRLNKQEVTRGVQVVPPQIGDVRIPASVHPGESFEIPLQLNNVDSTNALLGSDDTAVTFRSGEKPTFTYRSEKPGTATVVLIVASPGNVISKKEITINVR